MTVVPIPPASLGVGRSEAELRDAVAAELRAMGHQVAVEFPCPLGGRVDIAVLRDKHAIELIEVKRGNPLPGLGQVLLYGAGWRDPQPHLVVLVPNFPFNYQEEVQAIFKRCGVELRICEPDATRAWEGRRQAREAEIAEAETELKRLREVRDELRAEYHFHREDVERQMIRHNDRIEELRALDGRDWIDVPALELERIREDFRRKRDRAMLNGLKRRNSDHSS